LPEWAIIRFSTELQRQQIILILGAARGFVGYKKGPALANLLLISDDFEFSETLPISNAPTLWGWWKESN
jgi:hypothetical protein